MLKFTWELDGSLKNCSSRYPIWAFPKHFLMGAIRRTFQLKSAQSIEPNWKFYIYFHMSSAHWFTVLTVPLCLGESQHCTISACAQIITAQKLSKRVIIVFISILILYWEKIKKTVKPCFLFVAWFSINFYMYFIDTLVKLIHTLKLYAFYYQIVQK